MIMPIPVSAKDLAEGVGLIRTVVADTIDIVSAINDGRAYLERKAPDTEKTWNKLMREMQKTVAGLAEVTKVVSDFRFSFGPSGPTETDLIRFDDYVMAQRREVIELRGRIRSLKGSSGQVNDQSALLHQRSTALGVSNMWGLLGVKGRQTASQLSAKLSNFYGADMELVATIEGMVNLADAAVADVAGVLGPAAHSYVWNIPAAADLLRVYHNTFEPSLQDLDELVKVMEETRAELRKGSKKPA